MTKMRIFNTEELEAKTVTELRQICGQFGIPKMSKARKDDIIDEIEDFYTKNIVKEEVDNNENTEEMDESKVPYINAHVHSFLKKDDTYESLVSVSCGASSSNYPVVGRTVGFIKATYREILNIDSTSNGVVNGVSVEDSYVLKSGDTLEFVRDAGSKG